MFVLGRDVLRQLCDEITCLEEFYVFFPVVIVVRLVNDCAI